MKKLIYKMNLWHKKNYLHGKNFLHKMIACMALCGGMLVSLLSPVTVWADSTSDKVLTMNTTATSLNKNDEVSVTFTLSGIDAASGFGGYLEFDTSVFGELRYNQFTLAASATTEKEEEQWSLNATYDANSHWLEVREASDKEFKPQNVLLTIKFVVQKSATETTIRFNYPEVYKGNTTINKYATGLSVKVTNSKAKKLVLATDAVSGNSSISIPVKFTTNDGFLTLALSASYDPTKLVFDSVRVADSVKSKMKVDSMTVTQSGTVITANISATEEIKTTGVLLYVNFKALNQTTSGSSTGTTGTSSSGTIGTTEVALTIDSATNKDESAFVFTGTKSAVTITEKEHTLGDVNGNNKIDLVDALYIIRYYNKVQTLTSVQLTASDVNKNGTVDLVDALLIMQYYNGVIKNF